MNQLGFPLLSLLLWLPAIGALALPIVPRENRSGQLAIALLASLAALLVAALAAVVFQPAEPGYQLAESLPWVASWGIGYSIGVDGVSIWMVVLTALVMPFAIAAARDTVDDDQRGFLMLMLLLETAILGVFLARDMFLFYVFFEFTLVPMALLVGRWGGAGRVAAATKFFIYTFSGSVFMLLGMIAIYVIHAQQTGTPTADLQAIVANMRAGAVSLDPLTEALLFGAFFLAFAVKAPLWPFHTWLPQLHAAAPNNGAVDIAAVLLKLGGYSMIRFNLGLFPETSRWAAPAIGVLATISIVYCAWVAYGQTDVKKLLAYSMVSHMGYIVLGTFALNQQGISGAILQMVNHGLSSSALFLAFALAYSRRGSRALAEYGGLWRPMPVLGGLTLVAVLAAIGLPGTNGFVGEFVIMQGAWLSSELGWHYVLFAVIGVILAAAYMLRMFRTMFMGELRAEGAALRDLVGRETLLLGLLVATLIVLGLYPNLLFGPMQGSVGQIAADLAQTVAAAP